MSTPWTLLGWIVILIATGSTPLAAAVAAAPVGQQPLADPWEDDSRPPQTALVINGFYGARFDTALIYPVLQDQRTSAIKLLEHRPEIPVSGQQLEIFLGSVPDVDGSLRAMIPQAEAKAEQLERDGRIPHGELILQQADQARNLIAYARDGIGKLKPYLVRAVVKYEGTGAFQASVVGHKLWMFNGCLGHSLPHSTRVPVIVFLRAEPSVVHTSAAVVAE